MSLWARVENKESLMIVCSCNVLSDRDLREAAEEMRADPNGKMPTPGSVFRKLGCRPHCGSCFPSVIELIHEKASATNQSGGASPVRDEDFEDWVCDQNTPGAGCPAMRLANKIAGAETAALRELASSDETGD